MREVDVVVCGGGPAGLSAALWLGRFRRRTLLVDTGKQRNLSATSAHGYLTLDRCTPQEFLKRARDDVDAYPDVRLEQGTIERIQKRDDRFLVTTSGDPAVAGRIVFAAGVSDLFPDIPGFRDLYGKHIFHCSCCDGYESRDMDVLAIGWAEHSAGYALDLLEWGARVTLVTNGNTFEGDQRERAAMARHGIDLIEDEVAELLGDDDKMTGALLRSGRRVDAQRAFFSIGHEPRSGLAASLGCAIDELGYIEVDDHGKTSVEHVYAAGDLTPGEQLVPVAASEGVIAGIACAMSLRGEKTVPGAPDPGPDPEQELSSEK